MSVDINMLMNVSFWQSSLKQTPGAMRFVAGHEPQIRQALVARATRSVSQKHAPGELFVSGPICHKHLRDGGEVFCKALEPFHWACWFVHPWMWAPFGGQLPDAIEHGLGKARRA
jgi:hypothetical protein